MKALTFFYCVTLGCISVCASMGAPYLTKLFEIPYMDKIAHFTFIGVLTLLVNRCLHFSAVKFFGLSVYRGAIILLPLVSLDEFTHLFLSNRWFSWFDLGCNYLGMLLIGGVFSGTGLAHYLRPPTRALINYCQSEKYLDWLRYIEVKVRRLHIVIQLERKTHE